MASRASCLCTMRTPCLAYHRAMAIWFPKGGGSRVGMRERGHFKPVPAVTHFFKRVLRFLSSGFLANGREPANCRLPHPLCSGFFRLVFNCFLGFLSAEWTPPRTFSQPGSNVSRCQLSHRARMPFLSHPCRQPPTPHNSSPPPAPCTVPLLGRTAAVEPNGSVSAPSHCH